MYTVRCTVNRVYYIVYNICGLLIMKTEQYLYIIRFYNNFKYIVHCTLYSLQYIMHNIHYIVYSVRYTMFTAQIMLINPI